MGKILKQLEYDYFLIPMYFQQSQDKIGEFHKHLAYLVLKFHTFVTKVHVTDNDVDVYYKKLPSVPPPPGPANGGSKHLVHQETDR